MLHQRMRNRPPTMSFASLVRPRVALRAPPVLSRLAPLALPSVHPPPPLPRRQFHASPLALAAPVNLDPNRKFPARKVFLLEQYQQIFDESNMVILLQFNSVSAAEMDKIRTELANVPLAPPGQEPVGSDGAPLRKARLMVVRNGIAKLAARTHKSAHVRKLARAFTGPMAMVHAPHFSPAYTGRVLHALDRALGGRTIPAPKDGGAYPREQSGINYRLTPLVALLEGKRYPLHLTRDASKLPELKDLQAQILGVLSAPGQKLAGALSQAAGGDVSLLLEARIRDLDPKAEEEA